MRLEVAALATMLLCGSAAAELLPGQRAAAERGDPKAQFAVALQYDTGNPTNYPEALRWFRMAAEGGYAVAEAKLGLMYLYGWAVRRDVVEAARWYKRAADQGHVAAQVQIGVMYLGGQGVPRNAEQGRRYLAKAAAQGNAWAAWRLQR